MILPISIDRVNKITQLRIYLRNHIYSSNMNHMIDSLYQAFNAYDVQVDDNLQVCIRIRKKKEDIIYIYPTITNTLLDIFKTSNVYNTIITDTSIGEKERKELIEIYTFLLNTPIYISYLYNALFIDQSLIRIEL